jgi:hypothetical protein
VPLGETLADTQGQKTKERLIEESPFFGAVLSARSSTITGDSAFRKN